MENIQAGLTKEFTENNWKKMQVKLMTIPQFKWYIEKCKVPQNIQPLIWKYRMIFGQNPAEVQVYPNIKFYIELELVKDSLKGQWKEPEPFHTEPYKQNLTSQEAIEQMVKTQLEAKFIQPCKRPGPYGVSAGKRDQIKIFFKKKFLSKIDVDLIIWSRIFVISKKKFLSIWSLFPALTPY